MRVLSRYNDIVWVNYHGTRRPSLTPADLKTGCSVVGRFLKGVRQATPSIIQVTPLVIPGVTRPLLRAIHKRLLVGQIMRAVRSIPGTRQKPLQVWSFAPDVQFEGLDTAAITTAENELIDHVDVLVTTSEALLKCKQARRSDAVLVRHGVDYDRFAQAWRSPPPRPEDLAPIPGPILGFFGLIDFWIDVTLLARVARLRPDYSFVLIGDCKSDVSRLRQLPNVYLPGRRRHEDLPAYCAAFRAGLLPFVRTPMTRNVNPIKMYEYLAAGLPVVSTPLPEAERYLGPITIAETPETFAQACDAAIATVSPGKREAISRTVEGESWESRVELLSNIIMARTGTRMRSASMPAEQVVGSPRCTGNKPDRPLHAATEHGPANCESRRRW
jgi:glycosyltransferase involved in cell wall biosynthesis